MSILECLLGIKKWCQVGKIEIGLQPGDVSCNLLVGLIAGGAGLRTVSPLMDAPIARAVKPGCCNPVIWQLNGICR